MEKTKLMGKAGKRLLFMVLTLTVTGVAWSAETGVQTQETWTLSEPLDGKTSLDITVLRGTGIADTQSGGTVYELGFGTGGASDYNRPFYLVKGGYYYFGEAEAGDKKYEYSVRTLLWDMKKVKVQNGGVMRLLRRLFSSSKVLRHITVYRK